MKDIVDLFISPSGKPKRQFKKGTNAARSVQRRVQHEIQRAQLERKKKKVQDRVRRLDLAENSHPPHEQILAITQTTCGFCGSTDRIPTTLLNNAKHKYLNCNGTSPAESRDWKLPLRKSITPLSVPWCEKCESRITREE